MLWQWQLEIVLQLPPFVEGQVLACWASATVLAGRKPSRQAQSYCLSFVSKRRNRQSCWLRHQRNQHTVNDDEEVCRWVSGNRLVCLEHVDGFPDAVNASLTGLMHT